jgi:hypothetical protein
MPAEWTQDRVLDLAPDSAAASAAQGLTNARKWGGMGVSSCGAGSAAGGGNAPGPRALWGECQGSGKSPYQVRIDLTGPTDPHDPHEPHDPHPHEAHQPPPAQPHGPTFKCSCPSRKFPCKHGLALLLMYARGEIKPGEPPQWVQEWLKSRDDRAQKVAERPKTSTEGTADPKAQARRAAERENKVAAGLNELELWLRDLITHGFAAARGSAVARQIGPGSTGNSALRADSIAARMVDAQAPGLARMLRELEAAAASGDAGVPRHGTAGLDGWQYATLEHIGRLHLLASAQRRLERFPDDVQADVRAAIGWTMQKEEVLARPGTSDQWLVIARAVEHEDRLRIQRTWLWGIESNRPALVLDFAVGPVGLDGSLVVGTAIDAEVVYFPSAAPQRALVKAGSPARALPEALPGANTLDESLARFAQVLARCPWREGTLLSVRNVVPVLVDGDLIIVDAAARALPVSRRFRRNWRLLALSGGHPVHLFAEWDGRQLLPLSLVAEGVFHDVGPRVGGEE